MFRQPRLSILLALACALFLRALVPVGSMWSAGPARRRRHRDSR